MEQTAKDAMAPKRLKTGGARPLIIAGIVLGVLVALYVGLCAWASTLDTFYRGYTINGVDVGGLTVAEAEAALREELPHQEIAIYDADAAEADQPLTTVTLSDLGLDSDTVLSTISVSDCFATDQKGTFFLSRGFYALAGTSAQHWSAYDLDTEACETALETLKEALDQEAVDASYLLEEEFLSIVKARDGRSIDVDDLRQALESAQGSPARAEISFTVLPAQTLTAQEIYDEVYGEVKNATYDAETDTIVPEEMGADFDVDAAQAALDAAEPGDTVTVEAQIQYPTVTAEDLETLLFRDVLATATTHVSGTAARINNVKLSAAACNGVVLNAGEVFSYNDTTGQRTTAKGYQAAPAYVGGETVDEIGGGVCQTSSTIYYACLLANLEITERYAHRYVPAYITKGMDATVSWGGPDYKFTNNTDYPIKIVATYSGGYLTVKILGTNLDGTYVKMTYEQLSSTPYETVYEDDPTLPAGTETVKTTPYTGYKVQTYRNVYAADGTLISSTYEATSDYKVRNKVILRGTAAATTDTGSGSSAGTDTGTSAGSGGASADTGSGTSTGTDTGTGTGASVSDTGSTTVPDTGGTAADTGEPSADTGGLPSDVMPEDEPFV